MLDFLDIWIVVGEMIKTVTDGVREFGSTNIRIVLTFSPGAIIVLILMLLKRIPPYMIRLGARGSSICILTMSVSFIVTFGFSSIVISRWVSIIHFLKGLVLLCRCGL